MVNESEGVAQFLRSSVLIAGGTPPMMRDRVEVPRRGDGAVEEIVSLLFRKRYRSRVGADRRERIIAKVDRALEERRPLTFVVPFGGYKHFWNPSAPEVDWAEVFHIDFMVEYLSPLLALLPGGVRVEYVSEDFIVPLMDNYAPEALDRYAASFRRLLGAYAEVLPAGLELDLWRLSERYDTDAIIADIQSALPERLEQFAALTREEQELELTRSNRSVHWTGWEDLTGLDEEGRRQRVVKARVTEMTFSDLGFHPQHVGGYYEEDLRCCVVFSWGRSRDNALKQFFTMHSSSGSIVDHWIGKGVLVPTGSDAWRPTIVSRSQYEAGDWNVHEVDVVAPIWALHNLRSIAAGKSADS